MTYKEYYLCPTTGHYFQKGVDFGVQAHDIHVIDIEAYKALQFKYKQLNEFVEKNLKIVPDKLNVDCSVQSSYCSNCGCGKKELIEGKKT